jgi:hypothetical protein
MACVLNGSATLARQTQVQFPSDAERLACGLDARIVLPRKSSMTLLVGQVRKDLPGGSCINIDVDLQKS